MQLYHWLDDLEKTHIVSILRQQNGNKARTTRILGIHRRKLYRLIARYGITEETLDPGRCKDSRIVVPARRVALEAALWCVLMRRAEHLLPDYCRMRGEQLV